MEVFGRWIVLRRAYRQCACPMWQGMVKMKRSGISEAGEKIKMVRTGSIRLIVVILFVLLAVSTVIHNKSSAAQRSQGGPLKQTKNPPAQEEEPKNLQVLKGMSRSQVITVMQSWSEALGVECNFCHVRPFEADTPRKVVARLMQREYVEGMKHRDGRALSCQDCHQGQPNFLRTRPFAGALGEKLPDIRVLTGMQRANLRQVMVKFTESLGVKCAYCHATDFEEETPRKQITRFMITEFARRLTKQDGSALSCADCHHGHGRLLSVVPFLRREERRARP